LKVLWSRHEESVLLRWRKDLHPKAPRLKSYEPYRIKCWECGERFTFEASEQKYFEKRGWDEPKRCPDCRDNRWFRSVGLDFEGGDEDEF
jgi:DNA-directed RNA polymerase subunit RPC12/RpoP